MNGTYVGGIGITDTSRAIAKPPHTIGEPSVRKELCFCPLLVMAFIYPFNLVAENSMTATENPAPEFDPRDLFC